MIHEYIISLAGQPCNRFCMLYCRNNEQLLKGLDFAGTQLLFFLFLFDSPKAEARNFKDIEGDANRQRPEDTRGYTKAVCFTLNIIKQALNFPLLMVDENTLENA